MARTGGGSSSSSADYTDGRDDSGGGGSGGGGGGTTGGTTGVTATATAASNNAALWALYASVRIGLANLSPISDCDEVYNYWEPVHFLHYGVGMQTWEYAPQYALRTFAYLLPVASLSKLYSWMISILPSFVADALARSLSPSAGSAAAAAVAAAMPNKPLQFRLLRSTLALCSALSELSLASSVSTAISPSVASWTLLTSIASAGMFHASPAYLPSSTVMVLWMKSASAQLKTMRRRRGGVQNECEGGGGSGSDNGNIRAIEWGLLAVLATGWPFCGALFLTTGLRAVYSAAYDDGEDSGDGNDEGKKVVEATSKVTPKRRNRSWSDPDVPAVFHLLLSVALRAVLLQSVVMVVDYAYYGRWVSPTLNIFAYNASGGGDELYGVEPLSYYVKNLLLNFNVVAILGIGSLPTLMVLRRLRLGSKPGEGGNEGSAPTATSLSSAAWTLSPMYVWLLIVVPRPHKEERFLFPIYPALCLGAAWVVDELAEEEAIGRWGPFNDGNEEEEGRYVDLGDCSYVIELVGGGEEEDEKEPPECARYMSEERGKWSKAAERDFLDSERTPFLHRVLYVPWARSGRVKHKSYALYERVG